MRQSSGSAQRTAAGARQQRQRLRAYDPRLPIEQSTLGAGRYSRANGPDFYEDGMDVTTIIMEPEEAQAKLDAYRKALEGRHSATVEEEWSAALTAYRELAKGTPLIDPIAAIREAGWKTDGRPVLAIGRADQKLVTFGYEANSRHWDSERKAWVGSWTPMTWRFRAGRARARWDRQRAANLTVRVENVTMAPPSSPREGTAMLPMVPPDVLPGRGADLSKHFVLWEVESWDFAPPVDPMLLRPIGGNLYAVVATWDLTEIERMIIVGTRRNS